MYQCTAFTLPLCLMDTALYMVIPFVNYGRNTHLSYANGVDPGPKVIKNSCSTQLSLNEILNAHKDKKYLEIQHF